MQTKEEVLKACTVSGMVVMLPPVELERSLYQDVAKALNLIGGKWNKKYKGFVFDEPPADLLSQISTGSKRDLKKEFQFFGTPDWLADEMAEDLDIEEYDLMLEPSAGQGALIKAVQRLHPGQIVHYCELMPLNRTFLEKLPDVQYITDNFLKLGRSDLLGKFDKVIANPPFTKDQDIDHIRLMWDCIKPGGRIVTIAGTSWQYGSHKKQVAFKKWIEDVEADVTQIDAGAFQESGTMVKTVKIILNKPE